MFWAISGLGVVVFIMSIILGMFWYLMGYTYLPIISYCVMGLIADLVLKAGKYKSFKMSVLGYWLFSCAMISCQAPMWLFAETYMEQVRSSMGDQYVAGLQKFMPPWMGFAAIGILFVSSLLGALLGRRMLKKHFERAGIV